MAEYRTHPLTAQLAAQIATHELFRELDTPTRAALIAELDLIELPARSQLFAEGAPGDALYIVASGRLRVVQGQRILREVGRGEYVGEFALITGEPRSATVYAVRDSNLVRLSQALFERVLQRYPRAMMQIAGVIVQRARTHLPPIMPGAASAFVLLPASRRPPPDTFAQQLTTALGVFGPTLYLSSARINALYGRDGVSQLPDDDAENSALVGWLGDQETRYHQIVYDTDPEWSAWTRRALRQADRLLLVAYAEDDPNPNMLERAANATGVGARTELILLYPSGISQANGTRAWLAARHVHTYHHVRLGHSGDMARLARRLTGRALGVVLSGGGARGSAHIGALHALEEAGLHADFIGGTSIGALIGALYATGRGYEALTQLASALSSGQRLLDYTLPFTAFNTTRKLTAVYRALFGETQIEDLWQRFFCVSSNLTRAEPVIHEDGLLWAAVRASTAIPVIFAPVQHANGDVLVDGGILNNFPIDIMRTRYEAGTVIGIDVAPPTDKVRDYRFGPSVSGWQQLWNRLNPLARPARAPSLLENLTRTIEVNSAYRVRSPSFRQFADLLIQMPDRPFGRLAFDIYPEMIEMGYREAQRQIETWQQHHHHAEDEQ